MTATLLATIAPYFAGIREVDRLLELDSPTDDDARNVANLLRTASQTFYFFERADERWLQPLAAIPRFLTTPPRLIEVADGYVQAPTWPQGRFLARVASAQPQLVVALVERIPATTNPRVVATIAEIARALPPAHAARLAPSLARRMSIPLAVEYAAIETGRLIRELGREGFAGAGAQLLMSVVNAAIASPRDHDWQLEQVLGEPLEAVAGSDADLGPRIRTCLRRLLSGMGPRKRHSTLWLPNVDRRPRYGVDAAWFVVNALYRVLLAAPISATRSLAAALIADREPVLKRIGLAAMAERPELVESSDALMLDPSRWDNPGTTRSEFRTALASLWFKATEDGRRGLLEYAERADEATEITERMEANDVDHDPDVVRRQWRSRLLYKIRDEVPQGWLELHGPLEPIEDDRNPEPIGRLVGSTSPFSEEELAGLDPAQLIARLRDWSPLEKRPFDGPDSEGLGRAGAAVVLSRLKEFSGLGSGFAHLPPVLVAQLTSAIERRVRDEEADDRVAAVELMLELAEAFLPHHDGDHDADMWAREIKRDIAGGLGHAANQEQLGEAESWRALKLLGLLLADPNPTSESDERDAANGYDAGMLALNSVRGAATTAMIELLLESHRTGRTALLEAASVDLRSMVGADHSRSVRAAIGLRLPWLLARDDARQREWLELLFGESVPERSMIATWQAYLLYARFFSDTATLLAAQYDLAVSTHEARPEDDRGRPRDEDEQLGIHVAFAHLLELAPEAEGHWLDEFYGRAAGWVRGRVTRWIAEQAANDEATPSIRGRARAFLEQRVATADPVADTEELKAVAWIASASDEEQHVLDQILLPALEKTKGLTENEPGAAGLAARLSTGNPRSAARLIQLLVGGDQWHSLPHVATAELRQALEQLMAGDDMGARRIASDVIDTLGAQGFLEFRELIGGDAN